MSFGFDKPDRGKIRGRLIVAVGLLVLLLTAWAAPLGVAWAGAGKSCCNAKRSCCCRKTAGPVKGAAWAGEARCPAGCRLGPAGGAQEAFAVPLAGFTGSTITAASERFATPEVGFPNSSFSPFLYQRPPPYQTA